MEKQRTMEANYQKLKRSPKDFYKSSKIIYFQSPSGVSGRSYDADKKEHASALIYAVHAAKTSH